MFFLWLVIGSMFDLSPQEPVGPPTPKRPRGRPKGSKNKGPRTALKVETDHSVQDIDYLINLWLQKEQTFCLHSSAALYLLVYVHLNLYLSFWFHHRCDGIIAEIIMRMS